MNWALTERARLDIRPILSATGERFGTEVRKRYRLLIEQAVADVAADPDRTNVHRADGSGDLRIYHTRHARARTPRGSRVGRPRHVIIFTVSSQRVVVLAVLHDAMDIPARLAVLDAPSD